MVSRYQMMLIKPENIKVISDIEKNKTIKGARESCQMRGDYYQSDDRFCELC